MALNILFVAAGGALGASLRYLLGLVPVKSAFPLQTFVTNLIGCFVIGIIAALGAGLAQKHSIKLSPQLVLFLKTGLCGGFTTFSTFALDSTSLFQNGHGPLAVAYMTASLVAGILCVLAGQFLVERFM